MKTLKELWEKVKNDPILCTCGHNVDLHAEYGRESLECAIKECPCKSLDGIV